MATCSKKPYEATANTGVENINHVMLIVTSVT